MLVLMFISFVEQSLEMLGKKWDILVLLVCHFLLYIEERKLRELR